MEFSFTDNIEVSDINKVPENFRPFYEKPDGAQNYKLKAEDPIVKNAVDSITGLNKALKASRAEAKNFKEQRVDLSPLKDFGENPQEIAESVQNKLQELNQQLEKGGKVNVDKIRQEIAEANAGEIKKRDTRIDALKNQLYGHLVRSTATSAVAEAKGVPELLMPFIENRVKVNEKDGEFQVHVVDEAGDIRYSGVTGKEMTIKELVNEMKENEKFSRLFESETPSGGGTPPNRGKAGLNPQQQPVSPIDKIRSGLNKGLAARGK